MIYRKANEAYAESSQSGYAKTKKPEEQEPVKEKEKAKKKVSSINAGLPPKSKNKNTRGPVTPSIPQNFGNPH